MFLTVFGDIAMQKKLRACKGKVFNFASVLQVYQQQK